MPAANNITRMLDSRGIRYQAFELPSEKLGAIETARLLHVDPAAVYKTIVVLREPPAKPILALVPAPAVVDLKKLAIAIGAKKLHLPSERQAEVVTGLQAGGISPLALLNKGFRVLIDAASRETVEVHISGGRRGLNIRMRVDDLAALTKARFAAISSMAASNNSEK